MANRNSKELLFLLSFRRCVESPLLVLGRRIVHHDASLTTTSHLDLDGPTTSSPNVAMSTASHSVVNPSLSAYRTTLASSGSTNRQRAATDSSSNGLLFSTERIKSNISLSVRPLRPSLTATGSSMSSAYLPSPQTQRHAPHQIRSRLQHDRLAANRGESILSPTC